MQENRQRLLLDTGRGYFRREGVNVMAFDDIYPEGHQSGVSILMHGRRIATCGDVRFEPTPGQWQPVPKQLSRRMDEVNNEIVTSLRYPDEDRNLRGMNPMIYPDAEMAYTVRVRGDGEAAVVTVDLEEPLPEELRGVACFNLELFPGVLFGQPWVMDGQAGIFPRQPNGPLRHRRSLTERSGHQRLNPEKAPFAKRETLLGSPEEYSPIRADDWVAEPYAEGRELSICPNDPLTRLRIECVTPESRLRLYDGRMNHNNGWFTVSSLIPAGRTEGALQWRITPNAVEGWRAPTVIQVSQVGYHPDQAKCAVLETDPAAGAKEMPEILEETPDWSICVKPVGIESEKEMPGLLSEQMGGSFYPVHRLDLNVGGVMVYARSREAAAELSRQIQSGTFQKEYIALVHGNPPEQGRMEDLLFKDAGKKKVYVVRRMRQGVKPAALEYRVLLRDDKRNRALVSVRLETGRTHQIRVQFASRGYPLVGDHKYGARDGETAPRLFSGRIRFAWAGRDREYTALPEWGQEPGVRPVKPENAGHHL